MKHCFSNYDGENPFLSEEEKRKRKRAEEESDQDLENGKQNKNN